MGLAFALLAWLAGTTLFTFSILKLNRLNPEDEVPSWFGRPNNYSGGVYLLRAAGAGLLFLAAFAWSSAIGYFSIALVFLGCAPALLLHVRHNRRVRTGATGH